ncbi:MAG: hypothetical protein JXC33_03460 [Deltaproteobacteria bacterium]|nr:hypothetical protein [Deltaproteobacteria bacterium]
MCIKSTTPYRYNVGDKVRVMLKGKYVKRVVTITRRFRVVTVTTPIPVYENYHEVIFEENGHVERTAENNLEPA